MPRATNNSSGFAFLHEPLPLTGGLLNRLGQLWLVLNCVVLSAIVGAVLLMIVVFFPWKWITGHALPDTSVHALGITGFALGFILGGRGAGWVVRRAGKRGVHASLFTLAFIPVVGTGVSLLCGAQVLVEAARRTQRARELRRARAGADALWVVVATTAGTFIIELDPVRAPISTHNFVKLVRNRFYDGTVFHRVVSGFVIQGGGYASGMVPKKSGRPIPSEWPNGLINSRGSVAVARPAGPDSGTSQFFINVVDNESLDSPQRRSGDAGYTVFGRVVDGIDVVDAIARTPTGLDAKRGLRDVPTTPVVITSMTLAAEWRAGSEGAE